MSLGPTTVGLKILGKPLFCYDNADSNRETSQSYGAQTHQSR